MLWPGSVPVRLKNCPALPDKPGIKGSPASAKEAGSRKPGPRTNMNQIEFKSFLKQSAQEAEPAHAQRKRCDLTLPQHTACYCMHALACKCSWLLASFTDVNPQKLSEAAAFAKTTVEAEALLTSRRAETLKMMLHLSCCELLPSTFGPHKR